MTYTRKQLPKYCHHKSTGRAFVRIGGKTYYLGKFGSDASRREYDRIIAEFVANGRQALYDPDEIPIESLIVRFLNYAETERNYSSNTKNRTINVLQALNDFCGKYLVSQFTPLMLKTMRRQMIDSGLALNTINQRINIVIQVFCWGSEEEIVPSDIAGALRMVKSLQPGQTSAVEYDPIEPVADDIVEKTLPHLKPQYQDMVRVQRFISGRPQDIFNMRACDIDQSGEVWRYKPYTHKTKKRKKIRLLPIGPRAQQILLSYLDRCKDNPEEFVFPRSKTARHYSQAYNRAIATACTKAGVPHWTPNQLRHAGGTEVRDKFGLEYAQAVLGHSSAKTTEIYAKASYEKAEKVAKEIG